MWASNKMKYMRKTKIFSFQWTRNKEQKRKKLGRNRKDQEKEGRVGNTWCPRSRAHTWR
jgi:hypothetical protein